MALDDPARFLATQARYGSRAVPVDILWNDTIATILSHRSVRVFDGRPLPAQTIETLVAAAQSAASSSNLQHWSIVAVTDRATKGALAILAGNQRHVDEAPLILLFVADLARTQALGQRVGVPTDGLDYLDTLLAAAVDTGLAAQNAAIAAESLGLGTVYIGGLRNKPAEVAELIDLPIRTTVLFGLVAGWEDPARRSAIKPRLPQAAILHDGRYDPVHEPAAIQAYDATSREFQLAQGLPPHGWSATVLARNAGAHALNGRETLRQTYAQQGFPLR